MPASDTLAETALRHRLPVVAPRPGRRIVAAIAILATTLSVMAGSAVPARADNDLAKALAAIAVVGIIAHAARAKERPPATAPKKPKPVAATRQVPAVCGIELSGSQTRATLYSENCMVQRGVSALPTYCAKPARIYGQRDFIYTADCLRQGGLSVPRN